MNYDFLHFYIQTASSVGQTITQKLWKHSYNNFHIMHTLFAYL